MIRSLEEHTAEFHQQGYTIVPDVLTVEEISATNAALDAIFAREAAIGPLRGWHNDCYKVAYMLPGKDLHFRDFPFNPLVLPLMQLLLGPRCVVGSLNGLSMTPGGVGQTLHLDQPETVPGFVLTVNALIALDDFTVANGATRVVPGSQNRPMPTGEERGKIEDEAIHLEAPAGSLIAFNGGLWHAGSRNSTSRPRRAIHTFYHRPWVVPQWDYPRSLSEEIAEKLTDEQRRIFGFDARPQWYDAAENSINRW